MLRRGEMPHFRALLETAAYGQLATSKYTISPVLWETISTGQPSERHGIGYHQHFEFPGVGERVRRLPYFGSLCNSPMGIRRLLTYTAAFAPWRGVPADSTDARVARLWEIASRNGISVGVYNWLNTGPTVPVDGFIHAYGVTPPLDYPPDLQAALPPLHPPAPSIEDLAGWTRTQLAYERAAYDRFVTLAARHQPALLMFYTHVGDGVNHLGWKRDVIGDRWFFSGFLRGEYVPGREVSEVNRALDAMLGDLLSRVSSDTTVVVVSDHGFGYRGYEHDNGPPGVLILRGPGVRAGPFTGAEISDVTPTLLHMLGLAVADDMMGKPLEIAAPGGPLDRPVSRVASYGPAASYGVDAEDRDPSELQRHEEYLRSLGYVN
jgi:predicted AlkP superfamily pyrophosphatase or phosphodiesterase